MKRTLTTTIAAVLVAGCTVLAQQSSPPTDAKRAEPATEAAITLESLLKDRDAARYRENIAVTAANHAMQIYGKTKEYGTIPDVATDKGVAKIRRDLVLAEAELAELLTRYLEKHPKVVQKRGKIESLKDGVANAEKRVFESIVNKAQLAKATTISLLIELRQRKSEQHAINVKKAIPIHNDAKEGINGEGRGLSIDGTVVRKIINLDQTRIELARFELRASGCQWMIKLVKPSHAPGDYIAVTCDGTHVSYYNNFSEESRIRSNNGENVGWNTGTAIILKSTVPKFSFAEAAGPIWMTYLAKCAYKKQGVKYRKPFVTNGTLKLNIQPNDFIEQLSSIEYHSEYNSINRAEFYFVGKDTLNGEPITFSNLGHKDVNTLFEVGKWITRGTSSLPLESETTVYMKKRKWSETRPVYTYKVEAYTISFFTPKTTDLRPKLAGPTSFNDYRRSDSDPPLIYKTDKWLSVSEIKAYFAKKAASKHLQAKSYLNKKAPELIVEKWLSKKPDFEDKFLLVDFWATWCGPCIAGIPKLNEYHKKFGDRMVVVGLSDETENKIRSMKKPNIEYFSAIDTKKRMKNEVEVTGIPHVMIIDPKGIVRWEGWPALSGQELTEAVIQDILNGNGSKTAGKQGNKTGEELKAKGK